MLLGLSGRRVDLIRTLTSLPSEPDQATIWRVLAEAADSYDEARATDLFARFIRNGTWVVPTLVSNGVLFGLNLKEESALKYMPALIRKDWIEKRRAFSSMQPADFEHGRRILSRQSAIVGAMHRAGVSILAGSDSANPYTYPGFSLHEELARLVQSGLTPLAGC